MMMEGIDDATQSAESQRTHLEDIVAVSRCRGGGGLGF